MEFSEQIIKSTMVKSGTTMREKVLLLNMQEQLSTTFPVTYLYHYGFRDDSLKNKLYELLSLNLITTDAISNDPYYAIKIR